MSEWLIVSGVSGFLCGFSAAAFLILFCVPRRRR